MNWTLETEELEHISKLMEKLEIEEDKALILCLVDKLSWANGYIEGVKLGMELTNEK